MHCVNGCTLGTSFQVSDDTLHEIQHTRPLRGRKSLFVVVVEIQPAEEAVQAALLKGLAFGLVSYVAVMGTVVCSILGWSRKRIARWCFSV